MSKKIIPMIAVLLISFGFTKGGPLATTEDSVPVLNRPAPEFHLKDLKGKIVSLSDFKGKVVVLDFWATWCVPCQQSFPVLNSEKIGVRRR